MSSHHLIDVACLEIALRTFNYNLNYPLWFAGAAFAVTKGLELLAVNSFISSRIPDCEPKNKAIIFHYNNFNWLGPIQALSKVILCMGILTYMGSFGVDFCKRNLEVL